MAPLLQSPFRIWLCRAARDEHLAGTFCHKSGNRINGEPGRTGSMRVYGVCGDLKQVKKPAAEAAQFVPRMTVDGKTLLKAQSSEKVFRFLR